MSSFLARKEHVVGSSLKSNKMMVNEPKLFQRTETYSHSLAFPDTGSPASWNPSSFKTTIRLYPVLNLFRSYLYSVCYGHGLCLYHQGESVSPLVMKPFTDKRICVLLSFSVVWKVIDYGDKIQNGCFTLKISNRDTGDALSHYCRGIISSDCSNNYHDWNWH